VNLRIWVRWLLFLSSYAPLFAVLLVRTWDHDWLRYAFAALIVIPVGAMLVVLGAAYKLSPDVLERVTVRDRTIDGAAYFATYVISFVPSPDPGGRDIAALVILVIVLGSIYVNSGLIHLNPTLSLLGWHVYDIRGVPMGGVKRESRVIIARHRIEALSDVKFVPLSRSVAVAKA
jgi:hypothetical protein